MGNAVVTILRPSALALVVVSALVAIRPVSMSNRIEATTTQQAQLHVQRSEADENPGKASALRVIASHTMGRINAEYEGGIIRVGASARLTDRRSDNAYVWALQIVDANGAIGMFQIYDHQLFSLTPGESHTPTFNEEFHMNLLPGEYRARVFVFKVDDKSPFEQLSGEDFAKHFFSYFSGCMGSDKFRVQ